MKRWIMLFAVPYVLNISSSSSSMPKNPDIQINLPSRDCIKDLCCTDIPNSNLFYRIDDGQVRQANTVCFKIPDGKWNKK